MTHLTSTLQTASCSFDLIMGNVLKRLSYTFSGDSHFPICGGIVSPGISPIDVSFRIKSFYLNLWRSCSSFLSRTISRSIWNIASRLRSVMLYLRRYGRVTSPYTYMTPQMEEKYWERAAASQRKLQLSDARYVDAKGLPLRDSLPQLPPLVMYYVPALPSEKPKEPKKLKTYFLSTKNYCKWHRMVFPGDDHPTLIEASRLRKMHDLEELQEIHRISRMLSDDEVFQRPNVTPRPWTTKYQRKWQKWRRSRREEL
ncbi:hypothetical protein CPB84DRAFT_1777523 [Gymnopilus junonius]|uniref:Uncharacterized protein n=1 Tax=Gymnopilus junonius TaxID=109634 RepID=A0A9P5NP34_GYMJU|nr:hypothetical protein CPB84DRAFT_1777523 [Gymnopilus junonius]